MSAWEYLEAGLLSLGLVVNGRSERADYSQAREVLKVAANTDPAMADAYLALHKAGVGDLSVLESLDNYRGNVGRALYQYGLTPEHLQVGFEPGLYLGERFITDADSAAAAYASALIGVAANHPLADERSQYYARAAAVIDDALDDNARASLVHYASVVLNFRTERWTYVESAATKISEDADRHIAAAARAALVVARAHLGMYSAALAVARQYILMDGGGGSVVQYELTDLLTEDSARAEILYMVAMCMRGSDADAGEVAEMLRTALARNPSHQGAQNALADPNFKLPVAASDIIESRTDPWNPTTAADPDELEQAKNAEKKAQMLAEAKTLLDDFVGLENVKRQVEKVKSRVNMNLERVAMDLPATTATHHLVFAGPPGTGKTTIARVVAKIYCGLGILKRDYVREVHRADLIGQHIGETEAKTNAVIDSCLDGVLFLDEAYTLVSTGAKNDFGPIALDTLLARMENDRDRLVVIIAGYTSELEKFLEANEGFNSRFPKWLHFPSYTPIELMEIGAKLAGRDAFIFDSDAQAKITARIERLSQQKVKVTKPEIIAANGGVAPLRPAIDIAGNGRFMRNIFEQSVEEQMARLDFMSEGLRTREAHCTITGADVEYVMDELLRTIRIEPEPQEVLV
ncbi:type VII secretion AAA-ATPase EccA [Mycobacteroides abscessus]|nr:type VII secretion AAA-ATPase EccA [Mycobacteroides abscessus]